MKQINLVISAVAITSTLILAGCTNTEQRTAGGAAIGAGTGAVVGGIVGGGRGAAVGAIVGGVGGAAVGNATSPDR